MKPQQLTLADRFFRYLFVRLPLYLLVISIGYVLSIGPMFWYWHEAVYIGDGTEYVTQLYYPLAILCDNNKFVAEWIDWYISLWIA